MPYLEPKDSESATNKIRILNNLIILEYLELIEIKIDKEAKIKFGY